MFLVVFGVVALVIKGYVIVIVLHKVVVVVTVFISSVPMQAIAENFFLDVVNRVVLG